MGRNEQQGDAYWEWMEMKNSDAGQQLLHLVQERNNDAMKQALRKAEQGDFSEAKNLIESILATPEAEDLIQKLRGNVNE